PSPPDGAPGTREHCTSQHPATRDFSQEATAGHRSRPLHTDSGAVARHQLQEVTVHTYDAQITLGAPQPLPDEAALDGVEEFLSTCCAWTAPWPHEAAAVDFHATEGRSWRLSLSAGGAQAARLPAPGTTLAAAAGEGPDVAFASARGTAAELVLVFYDRIPLDSLQLDGDRRLFDLLRAWE
ncbi:MAG: hypothetical protein ACRDPY_40365, partial [Streptosporangiaceae bacterium]